MDTGLYSAQGLNRAGAGLGTVPEASPGLAQGLAVLIQQAMEIRHRTNEILIRLRGQVPEPPVQAKPQQTPSILALTEELGTLLEGVSGNARDIERILGQGL